MLVDSASRPTNEEILARARARAERDGTMPATWRSLRNHLSAAIGKTSAANRAEAVPVAEGKGWL